MRGTTRPKRIIGQAEHYSRKKHGDGRKDKPYLGEPVWMNCDARQFVIMLEQVEAEGTTLAEKYGECPAQ